MRMPLRQVLAFLAVLATVSLGLHSYLRWRLVESAGWPAPWGALAGAALLGAGVLLPLGMVAGMLLPRRSARFFAWPAFVWMGAAFFLLVLALPADLARGLAWASRRWSAEGAAGAGGRGRGLVQALSAGVGLGALGLSVAALRGGLGGPRLREVRLPLPRLPAGLEGLTLVQLSDVHVGPTIGRAFIEDLVARTNALAPDLVVITGDLVDGTVAQLGPLVEPLKGLRAPLGVFFVTGNHEYYSGAPDWERFLPSLGVRVLRNERVRLEVPGRGALELAGVDDWTAHHFGHGHGADLPRALAGRDPALPLVLLAHQPKQAEAAARAGVDLQLSGHTHAGQLWPFSLLVRLDTPYVRGLHRVGGMLLYVSSGTGYWGPPMRLGTASELTRLTLVRPPATA
jgi:predicted MPP superfamily phosphohydrolase